VRRRLCLHLGIVIFSLVLSDWICRAASPASIAPSPYARWSHGPPADPGFFPIAVWLQNPAKADRYREAGFNTFVGLWKGPTEDQLKTLRAAGMKVLCHQNEVGLKHRDDPTIIGWMHGDEPDNAQSLGPGKGYGPPIAPARIVEDYRKIRADDPSRPVLLNLGQGVAWDRWHGRGVRSNHPQDYAEYLQGCDIGSFDIYPAVHDSPDVAGKLWYVARGVERLRQWAKQDQIIWNCIECTRIHHPTRKATPQQVRAEVWMSIVHGSMGLIYFVHEWKPRFNESAVLDDPPMLAAIQAINRQLARLAPVLNASTLTPGARVVSDPAEVPLATVLKRHDGALYLFAVAMREGETTASFEVPDAPPRAHVEVLGEHRQLAAERGCFQDAFKPWDVHLYRIQAAPTPRQDVRP
jgi:hypothetical protein